MIFTKSPKFPEFVDVENDDVVYQLDTKSRDEDELIGRGNELVEKNGMEISEFKIKTREDWYALYVR